MRPTTNSTIAASVTKITPITIGFLSHSLKRLVHELHQGIELAPAVPAVPVAPAAPVIPLIAAAAPATPPATPAAPVSETPVVGMCARVWALVGAD